MGENWLRSCHIGNNKLKSILSEFYIYQEWKGKFCHQKKILNSNFADVSVKEYRFWVHVGVEIQG